MKKGKIINLILIGIISILLIITLTAVITRKNKSANAAPDSQTDPLLDTYSVYYLNEHIEAPNAPMLIDGIVYMGSKGGAEGFVAIEREGDYIILGLTSRSIRLYDLNSGTFFEDESKFLRFMYVKKEMLNTDPDIKGWFTANATLIPPGFLRILINKEKEIAYEEGYNAGKAEGGDTQAAYQQGYNAGKTAGYKEGYDKGKTDGYTEGFEAGKAEQTEGSYNEGYRDGLIAGSSNILATATKAEAYTVENKNPLKANINRLANGIGFTDIAKEADKYFFDNDINNQKFVVKMNVKEFIYKPQTFYISINLGFYTLQLTDNSGKNYNMDIDTNIESDKFGYGIKAQDTTINGKTIKSITIEFANIDYVGTLYSPGTGVIQAYDDGYSKGQAEGYQSGYDAGIAEGNASGKPLAALIGSVQAALNTDIIGTISIGDFLNIALGILLVFAVIRFFAGG